MVCLLILQNCRLFLRSIPCFRRIERHDVVLLLTVPKNVEKQAPGWTKLEKCSSKLKFLQFFQAWTVERHKIFRPWIAQFTCTVEHSWNFQFFYSTNSILTLHILRTIVIAMIASGKSHRLHIQYRIYEIEINNKLINWKMRANEYIFIINTFKLINYFS